MPSASELRAMYKRMCRHPLIVRRYTGTGADRAPTDYPVRGNIRLYNGNELIGTIAQGDYLAIILAKDLDSAGLTSPLKTSDKVVWQSRELSVVIPPGTRSALDGTLIAYEVQARG